MTLEERKEIVAMLDKVIVKFEEVKKIVMDEEKSELEVQLALALVGKSIEAM